MRIATLIKALGLVAFAAFVLVAFLDPGVFAAFREHASASPLWLALSLLAAGCGASLMIGLPALGDHAHISLPLFLALAAPYALRLAAFDALARWLRRPAGPAVARPSPRAYPEGAPAALPPRAATALIAAARARR